MTTSRTALAAALSAALLVAVSACTQTDPVTVAETSPASASLQVAPAQPVAAGSASGIASFSSTSPAKKAQQVSPPPRTGASTTTAKPSAKGTGTADKTGSETAITTAQLARACKELSAAIESGDEGAIRKLMIPAAFATLKQDMEIGRNEWQFSSECRDIKAEDPSPVMLFESLPITPGEYAYIYYPTFQVLDGRMLATDWRFEGTAQ